MRAGGRLARGPQAGQKNSLERPHETR